MPVDETNYKLKRMVYVPASSGIGGTSPSVFTVSLYTDSDGSSDSFNISVNSSKDEVKVTEFNSYIDTHYNPVEEGGGGGPIGGA